MRYMPMDLSGLETWEIIAWAICFGMIALVIFWPGDFWFEAWFDEDDEFLDWEDEFEPLGIEAMRSTVKVIPPALEVYDWEKEGPR